MLTTTPNTFLERAKAPKLVANANPLTLVVKSKVFCVFFWGGGGGGVAQVPILKTSCCHTILGPTATVSAFFGQGGGPIALNTVACTGSEARLLDCPSGSVSGCTHASDVGARCSTQTGTLARPQ